MSGQAVLDEAHNLEKVAASYLGPELNNNLFITAFNQVFTIKPIETGFLALLKTKLIRLEDQTRSAYDKTIGKIQGKLLKARGKMGEFFDKLSNAASKIPTAYENSREIRYNNLTEFISQELIDDSIIAVKSIETMLMDLAGEIEANDAIEDKDELAIRARAIAQDIQELRRSLEFLTYPDETDYVYWIELGPKRDARLLSSPLNVGKILDEKLYDQLKTLVLCSATLSVAGNFDFYKSRLGLDLSSRERVIEIALDSPFNLKKNIGFFEAGFMPAPNTKNFDKQAAETIYELFAATQVRGMVLFTSYRSITSVLDAIGERLIAKGFELFVQSNNMSPFQLLSRYRQSPRGIIFGTDSFWEGVDLPGEELELLIIVKLPFSVPDRPWIKANLERVEKAGGNPFMDFSLPEAIIKFRQGFGRLIRKKTDRGCVVSLDSRLSAKQYGRLFVMSVKPPLRVCPSLNSLLHSTGKYLSNS
jgi:Rad3-related DNA helicase